MQCPCGTAADPASNSSQATGGAGATAFEAVAQRAGQLLLAGSVAVQPGNATNHIGLHAICGVVLFQALPIGWAVARL